MGIARLFCLGGCSIFILSYISLHGMSISSDSGRKAVYGDPKRCEQKLDSIRRGDGTTKENFIPEEHSREVSLTSSSYFVVVHQVYSHISNSGQVYTPELVKGSRRGRHPNRSYRQNYGADLWTLSMGRGPRGRYSIVFKQASALLASSLAQKLHSVILNHSSRFTSILVSSEVRVGMNGLSCRMNSLLRFFLLLHSDEQEPLSSTVLRHAFVHLFLCLSIIPPHRPHPSYPSSGHSTLSYTFINVDVIKVPLNAFNLK